MLNQVFVFGFFHADLHPANIFVLAGDAIGYMDFGIVGQLPNRIRESLTRYSWLLFRGEIEAAVTELMRWLAPTSATDVDGGPPAAHPRAPDVPVRRHRRPLARDRRGAGPDRREPREPVLEARRRHPRDRPRPPALDVAQHRRLPQDAGHARARSGTSWRSTTTCPTPSAASCAGSPASRASAARPAARRWTGCTPAAGQVQRALDFVDFLEAQEPAILEAEALLFGFRRQDAERRSGPWCGSASRSSASAPCCIS